MKIRNYDSVNPNMSFFRNEFLRIILRWCDYRDDPYLWSSQDSTNCRFFNPFRQRGCYYKIVKYIVANPAYTSPDSRFALQNKSGRLHFMKDQDAENAACYTRARGCVHNAVAFRCFKRGILNGFQDRWRWNYAMKITCNTCPWTEV